FAAAMSSVDTSLNSSATVFLKDIYGRYIDRDVSERRAMLVLRLATIAIGVIGTGVALALIGQKSILDAWWKLQGIFAGGMLGLFLLGMVARRATGGAALVAVILGVAVIGWMTFYPTIEAQPSYLRNPLHANMTIVIGTLTIFLVGLGISRLFKSFGGST
ncbi:MAG: sodium:solute symporter, partial [Pirellulaceae bacterium]|nr:sodium:solute symporter [Pirellulaceae bacterium]